MDQSTTVCTRSHGSVEGRIEAVHIEGQLQVIVHQDRTGRAITCRFPPERAKRLLALAYKVMGRRVIVTGIVHADADGEPVRVDVHQIRALGGGRDLPTAAEIGGSDPAFTGALTTDEYIRSIRGG